MLVVGLTGNIASGKSTVAALFAANGAAVIDADQLARAAVAPGTPGLAAVAQRWPQTILADGSLDRAALRQIVFDDATERNALNAIVHPDVAHRRDALVSDARARGTAIVVYDVPLLFEAGLDDQVDAIVVVDAPTGVRRERLIAYRGLTAAEANAMIAAQMPSETKRARANFVIENDGDRGQLAERAGAVWSALARVATPG